MIKKTLAGTVATLALLGLGALYVRDAATADQAVLVETFIRDYCKQNESYPGIETLEHAFPHLYPDQDWYYWPNETHTIASFQYPMTLPFMPAPGHSKISEFMPVIYAYLVKHPCAGELP